MGEEEQRQEPAPRSKPERRADTPGADHPPEEELSAEEQMARFEEAMKDEDWGHQPC